MRVDINVTDSAVCSVCGRVAELGKPAIMAEVPGDGACCLRCLPSRMRHLCYHLAACPTGTRQPYPRQRTTIETMSERERQDMRDAGRLK